MISVKDTNKLLKNVLRAIPAVTAISSFPFVAKKRTPVLPFVLGGIAVAALGGVAALMVFSPRTRYRALDIAKDGYGKVRGQLDEMGISEKLGLEEQSGTQYSNGVGKDAHTSV
ncbi:MAG: hypothetical protein JWP97_3454 [Labilithrix sp.]|nr:hypothetical protein [Labilithrix sp.]